MDAAFLQLTTSNRIHVSMMQHPYHLEISGFLNSYNAGKRRIVGNASQMCKALHNNDPGIPYDLFEVSARLSGVCVLDQLGPGRAERFAGGKHGDCRTKAAHADAAVPDRSIETFGVKIEDMAKGFIVLLFRCFGRFVMAHVRARHDENVMAEYFGFLYFLFLLTPDSCLLTSVFNRPCARAAYLKTALEPDVEHLDGDDGEILFEILDKGKLDLEGMFP